MKIFSLLLAAGMLSAAVVAPAATVTFSGLTNNLVSQSTYSEAGFTFTSIDGNFWGYPDGGQLHMDPSGLILTFDARA